MPTPRTALKDLSEEMSTEELQSLAGGRRRRRRCRCRCRCHRRGGGRRAAAMRRYRQLRTRGRRYAIASRNNYRAAARLRKRFGF